MYRVLIVKLDATTISTKCSSILDACHWVVQLEREERSLGHDTLDRACCVFMHDVRSKEIIELHVSDCYDLVEAK